MPPAACSRAVIGPRRSSPSREAALRRLLAADPGLAGWRPARTERIATGFYTSQALELARP
jgi:magnesium-protoporphyrin O-methyltransferase